MLKHSAIALALVTLAGASYATDCKNGAPHSTWPACTLPTPTTPAGGPVSAESDASAAAGAIGVGLGLGVGTGGSSTANAAGGAGGQGGAGGVGLGGAGGAANSGGNILTGGANTATSTGTNVGINGQQQGIDRSGNSASASRADSRNQNTAAQGQRQANQSMNTNANAATAAGAGAGAGSGNATSNAVTIEGAQAGSGDKYESRVIVHPSMVPPSMVAMNPQGNLIGAQTSCGPLMVAERRKTFITVQGFFGGTEQREAGEETFPVLAMREGRPIGFEQVNVNGRPMFLGSMVMVTTAVLNRSMAVNGAAGLIRSSGSGGQVGGGGSSAVQELQGSAMILPCFIPAEKPLVAAAVQEAPAPAPMLAPRADRN